MPQSTIVSVEDYLLMAGEPDVEYVDGEIVDRPMGNRDHSNIQKRLILHFGLLEGQLGIRVQPEFRTRTKTTRFRVPDVLIEDASTAEEEIVVVAPLLCIEILSPEDRLNKVLKKVEEYLEFGVPCVWVIAPDSQEAWSLSRGENGDTLMHHVSDGVLATPDAKLSIPLEKLFRQ
jgi:Uma2 family endonuclease